MIKKKKRISTKPMIESLYVVVYSSVLLSRSVSLKISSLDSCVRCSPDAENGRPEEGGKKRRNDTPHFEPSFISPLKPEGCQKFARRGVTLDDQGNKLASRDLLSRIMMGETKKKARIIQTWYIRPAGCEHRCHPRSSRDSF
jgi:hypothetical protein